MRRYRMGRGIYLLYICLLYTYLQFGTSSTTAVSIENSDNSTAEMLSSTSMSATTPISQPTSPFTTPTRRSTNIATSSSTTQASQPTSTLTTLTRSSTTIATSPSTTQAATFIGSSTDSNTTLLKTTKKPKRKENKNNGARFKLDCGYKGVIYRPYFSPLQLNCTLPTEPHITNPIDFEIWFKPRTRFGDFLGDKEDFVGNHTRTSILLFSSRNGSVNSMDLGDATLGILQSRIPDYTLYNIPIQHTEAMSLGIKSVESATSGVYTWRVYGGDGLNKTVLGQVNVSVVAYHPPSVNLTPRASLFNKTFEAVCAVANYFPPRSTKLTWYLDGKPIERQYISDTASVWIDGLITRSSVLAIPTTETDSEKPDIRCDLEWHESPVSYKRFTKSVAPDVYYPPTVSVTFADTRAICDVKCVPRDGISLMWKIGNYHLPKAMSADILITGPCIERPGLVNIQSMCDISETDGPVSYTCQTIGYPPILPGFYDTQVYDASPEIVSESMLVSVVAVILGAVLITVFIFITALCLYYSHPRRL
ncbi:envelope glycoprotein C [Felid alphaherpesvirus 1]|uniref:Envelope glycoprotein C n=1 Tax=Feline herpesvirus 1 TaxID=10334 RepID=A0A173DXB5_FHV1|nr:envelope glycoprotein C [Felid alphaherpesvirus 1]ANG65558.1 envelope glycoprotein C [Felid alphaherpesvirus 1]AVW80163.1 envelope glycoprotein C [Felid alphaherpesvirus 1]AVW80317.1 envelope glycoprotein C [Felid alphaherpesvirus 1]AVW80394.1 envelope glycoprotein C [Felid alphaherpesvirus 1]